MAIFRSFNRASSFPDFCGYCFGRSDGRCLIAKRTLPSFNGIAFTQFTSWDRYVTDYLFYLHLCLRLLKKRIFKTQSLCHVLADTDDDHAMTYLRYAMILCSDEKVSRGCTSTILRCRICQREEVSVSGGLEIIQNSVKMLPPLTLLESMPLTFTITKAAGWTRRRIRTYSR